MNAKHRWAALWILLGIFAAGGSRAQVTFSEDFTGTSTSNNWYYFGGACLTAGTSPPATNPGVVPACTSVLTSYYNLAENADPYMMGGYLGYLGSSTAPGSPSAQAPDPVITTNGVAVGYGALRFTNGSMNISGSEKYGHGERGAILSSTTMPTNAGIQITFKTVTYHGDSGGQAGVNDGADGISFFLQDGSQTPGLGAWGGSLAYSCSNSNTPHDGLVAGYIGLGVDEYGNFLNGSNLVSGYTGTNVASGDNTAYGYGYKPERIGLRGAGNISWASLSNAVTGYGTNPNNSALPYYPASLATSCTIAGGVYNAATQNCIDICSTTGSFYDSATGLCNKACPTNATYDAALNTCNSCASVSGTYNSTTTMCTNTNQCAVGSTYYSGSASCNACPAAGYATGTYSAGTCIKSCPTGYTLTGTSCYPTGAVYSSGYYCPSGSTITSSSGGYVCYTSGLSYSGGNYCPSGQTISGTSCYPTGDVYSSAGYYCPGPSTSYSIASNSGSYVCYPSSGVTYSGGYYCPTGQTLTGSSCYPSGSVYSSGFYCPSGSTIVSNSGTYVCYTSGLSYSAGYYCPSGKTINGTSCYPSGSIYSAGYYCPSGNAINGQYCYPSTAVFSGGYYCASGNVISGTSCYPSGKVYASGYYCSSGYTPTSNGGTYDCDPTGLASTSYGGGYYCASGNTISGQYCYPNGDSYSTGKYCASGKTIDSVLTCCPTSSPYSSLTGKCSNGTTPTGATAAGAASTAAAATVAPAATAAAAATAATAASAAAPATAVTAATAATPATPMTAASAAGAATAVTASQTVTPVQTATLNTTPTESPPSTYAPGTGNVDAQYAVQNTCSTGNLYNYSSVSGPTSAGTATLGNAANTAGILDYAPIPNAYKELTSFQIANESAMTRGAATPIFYNLQITQNGLLSFSYSVSGGAYSYLIKSQSITSSNGPLPTSFRVGFAGSDGGASNIHEIMCFKASTFKESGSSATANEKESAKVETGTQAYFAYYNPSDWTGTVTANALLSSGSGTSAVVTVSPTANWDASCVLNGTTAGCANTGSTSGTGANPAFGSRVILTWDPIANAGIPFEWTNLNAAEQAALDFGDSSLTSPNRLAYLRGDRSNEINTSGVGSYRARDSILGDIVDSSPIWQGPPNSPYTATWSDRLYGGAMAENSGTQSYLAFSAAEQTRLNVVYVGANDGFLHGFEAGSFDVNGNFVDNSTTPNTGVEVLAYMPGSTIASAALATATGGCTNDSNTQTLVQGIHGVTPAVGANAECTEPVLDYANPQYGHNFFVDATPGSGDLFYGGVWHTWLVSGLGAGGQAIFALDITNPTSLASPATGADNVPFSEGNASSIVIGEWNSATINCINVPNCGNSMGNTFGTPQIRRLHNGNWAVIFGNGFGSATGDAGIYIMSIDHTSSKGTPTFYYLSTGSSGANGIAYVTPADLDGDHITDYVYAGDLYGNVWRFDLSSNNPSSWGVGSAPLFTTQSQTTSLSTNADTASGNVLLFASVSGVSVGQAVSGSGIPTGTYVQSVVGTTAVLSQSVAGDVPSGTVITFTGNQPITSQLLLVSTILTGGAPRILLEFGTGQRTQLTNLAPVQYASGVQSLYAVWDWNFSAWNSQAPGAVHQSLAATAAATGLGPPYTLTYANLAAQTFTANTNGTVDGTNVPVCWQGSTSCVGVNNQFGAYVNLPSSGEQIIYNPVFNQGSFQVNSVVPANNIATSCSSNLDNGYTYALNIINLGIFTNTFPTYTAPNTSTVVTDAIEAGVETNATGSVYNVTSSGGGAAYIVYQTISGVPGTQKVNIPSNTKSKRLTWIEQR